MDLFLSDEHDDLIAATRDALGRPAALRARLVDGKPPAAEHRLELLKALGEFGLAELDLEVSADLLSAALIVEQCGRAGAAVPAVAFALGRGIDGVELLHVIAPKRELMLSHLDLGLSSRGVDLAGRLYRLEPLEPLEAAARPRRDAVPLASRVAPRSISEEVDPWLWAAGVTLIAFGALGQLSAALELAVDHVNGRVQFGRPLAAFQAVRHRIADLVIARNGLRELCHHTLWRLRAERSAALVDALLLRRHQTRVMRKAMLSAHQLHGAMGFCYEYPLVGLTLAAEYDRHVPLTESECLHELVKRYTEIDMHYDAELAPAWSLVRTDEVPAAVRG